MNITVGHDSQMPNVQYWVSQALPLPAPSAGLEQHPHLEGISPAEPNSKRIRLELNSIDSLSSNDSHGVSLSHIKKNHSVLNASWQQQMLLSRLELLHASSPFRGDTLSKLKSLIVVAPSIIYKYIGNLSCQINGRALDSACALLEDHTEDDAVQTFFQEKFWDFIKKTSATEGQTKRDALIEEIITTPTAHHNLVKFLIHPDTTDFIFPNRGFTNNDFERFKITLNILDNDHPELFDFIVSNTDLISNINIKPEKLQYALCVAIKRLGRHEPTDLKSLTTKHMATLAQELLKHNSPMEADALIQKLFGNKKTFRKTQANAQLMVFFAEHPGCIKPCLKYLSKNKGNEKAQIIKKLHAKSSNHLLLFLKAQLVPQHAHYVFIKQNPHFLLGMEKDRVLKLSKILTAYNPNLMSSFYELKNHYSSLHTYCEVINRSKRSRVITADNIATRKFCSERKKLDQALEKFIQSDNFHDFNTLRNEQVFSKIHETLASNPMALNEGLRERLTCNAHWIRTQLPLLAKHGSHLDDLMLLPQNHDLFATASDEAISDFMKAPNYQKRRITECNTPLWRSFFREHISSVSRFSETTLNELMRLFDSAKSQQADTAQQAKDIIQALHQQWSALACNRDDQGFHRLFEVANQNLRQTQRPSSERITSVHDHRLRGKVAKTAEKLLQLFPKAGWRSTIRKSDQNEKIIEPIVPISVNEKIASFRQTLLNDIHGNAHKLASFIGKDKHSAKITIATDTEQNRLKLYDLVFTQVKKISRHITTQQTLLDIQENAGDTHHQKQAIESNLRKLRDMLHKRYPLIRTYGALQYLESKHMDSPPKSFLDSTLPKLSLKQMVGMLLHLPELKETALWQDGLTSYRLREEGALESLIDALNDSHIAYLGSAYDDNDSCWDGGASRLMLAARHLIKFDLLPEPGDFADEFKRCIEQKLITLASPSFLDSTDKRDIELRQQIQATVHNHPDIKNQTTLPLTLFHLIEGDIKREMLIQYPAMDLIQLREEAQSLFTTNIKNAIYIPVPDSFRQIYFNEMPR